MEPEGRTDEAYAKISRSQRECRWQLYKAILPSYLSKYAEVRDACIAARQAASIALCEFLYPTRGN